MSQFSLMAYSHWRFFQARSERFSSRCTGIFYSTIQIGDFLKREQKSLANKCVLYPFKRVILNKINIKIAWKNSQCERALNKEIWPFIRIP